MNLARNAPPFIFRQAEQTIQGQRIGQSAETNCAGKGAGIQNRNFLNDSVRKNRLVCEDTFQRFLRILPTINPILHEWTGSCWKIGTYAKGRNGSCNRNNIQESKRKLKTKREQYEGKMKSFFGQVLCGRENIEVDADLLFEMANWLGVSIPLRTKGWIRTSTITVSDGQVSAYQYSGGRSSAFFKYANQILSALQQLQSVV